MANSFLPRPVFEWECKGAFELRSNCGECPKCKHYGWPHPSKVLWPDSLNNTAPQEKDTKWTKTKDRLPEQGMLIVKRWSKKGTYWAGFYSGSVKDVSFDEWYELPK